MWMRGVLILGLLLSAWTVFAQSDRGTITGAVSDPTGAVIPGANIIVTNTETAAKYETISTETGNYTLAQLPSGPQAVPTRVNNNDPNSPTTGGFGYIDTSSVNLAPRQGQIVARFEF